MSLLSILLEENTRRVIRRAIANGSLRGAIVPLAATEQHNEHLAMNHDTRSVMWIAQKAAFSVFPAAVVTPPLNIGVSGHWMNHPGTLTLSEDVFTSLVYEVCDSLRRAGLRRILLLNGHGGNRRPVQERLSEFRGRLGIEIEFCSYWEAYSREFIEQYMESGECPGHAAEFETSVALALFPDGVHPSGEPYPQDEIQPAEPRRAADDRRFFAEAELASPEKGRVMMEAAAAWVSRLLETFLQR
jgi:creatinine amidohydrolase